MSKDVEEKRVQLLKANRHAEWLTQELVRAGLIPKHSMPFIIAHLAKEFFDRGIEISKIPHDASPK